MPVSQQASLPPSGRKARITDLFWLARYCWRGLIELTKARLVFSRLEARDVLERNQTAYSIGTPSTVAQDNHLERITYVIPRISKRLPWRSDCIVQAIAAQNWLLRNGYQSEIQIGVERPDGAPFAAHAWLVHDGKTVTGGDISRYEPLLGRISLKR